MHSLTMKQKEAALKLDSAMRSVEAATQDGRLTTAPSEQNGCRHAARVDLRLEQAGRWVCALSTPTTTTSCRVPTTSCVRR
jgi:hypothetical protein